jgi:hypothetical protein
MAISVKSLLAKKASRVSVPLREPDTMKAIAETAYYLWQKRGCPHGSDQQDWLEAEKIVADRKA